MNTDNTEVKTCLDCKIPKPATNEHFPKNTGKNRDGLYPYCKPCARKRSTTKNQRRRATHKGRAEDLLRAYQRVDKAKGQHCDMDKEYFVEFTKQPCTYCGSIDQIGADRKDNDIGHTKANTVPCCWDCNGFRNNRFTHEEMLLIGATIKAIKENRIDNKRRTTPAE